MPPDRTKLTPPELARRWGVSPDKILAFIRSGELRAVNAAASPNGRPRWLIDLADLAVFEQAAPRGPNRRPPGGGRRRRALLSSFEAALMANPITHDSDVCGLDGPGISPTCPGCLAERRAAANTLSPTPACCWRCCDAGLRTWQALADAGLDRAPALLAVGEIADLGDHRVRVGPYLIELEMDVESEA